MENQNLKVTSIEELIKYSQEGEIVSLPPFAEGKPFVARLQRPSMMTLAKEGKIPNSLLSSASKLFVNGSVNGRAEANEGTLEEMFGVIDVICEASFVEPTYQQIKDNNIRLTDEQYLAVFNFCQTGVESLQNFR